MLEILGKTTLALHAIAECQKAGGTAAFVDAEHALDPVYGTNRFNWWALIGWERILLTLCY